MIDEASDQVTDYRLRTINQLLFADDTALVADSEEKLRRLVSEFGRVCERRKLRVNVGKSKVMRCSRYGNGDRMHVIPVIGKRFAGNGPNGLSYDYYYYY